MAATTAPTPRHGTRSSPARLAATETNIAYRAADHERWQQLDFIVGIEVHLSNNHTCLGNDGKPHPFYDICDELKGKYPKDFKFTGWHPHCRCIATTILKTEAEMDADDEAILRGEEPADPDTCKNAVTELPDNFTQWLADNEERAKTRYSVPYFLRDNLQYVPKEFVESYGARMPYATFAEYEAAMRYNKKHANFSDEIKANNRELSQVLPVVQGKIMNTTKADGGNVNPLFDADDNAHSMNCATCVPTYILRRRGFDVNAGEWVEGKGKVYSLYLDSCQIWKRTDGTTINWQDSEVIHYKEWVKGRTWNQSWSLKSFIETTADEPGIYMVRLGWNNGGGHLTVVELTKEKNLIYYDPQSGKKNWLTLWEGQANPAGCWILRVDDKLIDPSFSECFVKAK